MTRPRGRPAIGGIRRFGLDVLSRRSRRAWLAGLAGLACLPFVAASPAQLEAQTGTGACDLSDNFNTIDSREVSPGVTIVWISRADLRCPNGLRIRSDSAVIYEASGRNELLGNVRFTTPERDLRADQADWYEQEGRLLARGSVVFGDLVQGTEVRGDTLSYLEARGSREEQVTVSGGRPSAVLPSDDGGDPFTVTANRLRFQGERFFWGDGQVDVLRDDLTAEADSLVYDREAGALILNRNALLVRGEVTAEGGTLNLGFQDDQLRSLMARNGGRIHTDEFILTGLEVEILLDADEELESLLAQGGDLPDGGGWVDAVLESDDLRLRGERVEVDEETEGTRVLRATGGARAEALGAGFGGGVTGEPDESAAGTEPASDPESGSDGSGEILDRDWLEGEEILAHFEPELPEGAGEPADADAAAATDAPEATEGVAGDAGTRQGWRLVRLESTANARALYRSPPEETGEADEGQAADQATDPGAAAADAATAESATASDRSRWPISYILADRIIIYLEAGDVSLLEAEGNVRGLQLEPRQGETG